MAFQDIRKPRQFLTPADMGFILIMILLIAALFALNLYLARTLKGGEWLFLRWSAARAFLVDGADPYSSTIAQRVQILAYGREAYLNEYPFALNDPFYIVLLYIPLALFSDFPVVHALWMLCSQAALVGIVLLALDLSGWEPPGWMTVLLIGFGLLSSFSVASFLSASPAIFFTLIFLGILTSLRARFASDEFAGILLCLIAYQWEISALFFFVVLVFAIANRRWGVISGFVMTLIILGIVSFLVNSSWAVPYIRAALFDWSRKADYTFATTLSYIFPSAAIPADRWLAAIAGAILLLETIRSVYSHDRHFAWVAFLALALNPMLGFAIFPTNHVVLLPALIMIIALIWERWTNRRALISVAALFLIVLMFYGLRYQTLNAPERLYSDALRILPPVLATIGLYWMRWWAIGAPRLWADQFGTRA